ncbi:hypothetical protein [Bacillus sp. 03113]|uniref:hypothetical protein n=1 Tax=Bacillus sp. 03113 TaxID=2578211 RepID=UPI00114293B3|nr:hypothetical protein [Bacillus sp. 03113]
MRLIDTLILLIITGICIFMLFSKKKKTRVLIFLGELTGISSIPFFIFRTTTWQMVPIYVYSVGLTLILLTRWKWWKTISIIGFLSITITLLLYVSFPIPKLPEPTGKYNIGRISYHMVDEGREEDLTSKNDDYRELMVDIWYPSDEKSNDISTYIPYSETKSKLYPEVVYHKQ